MLFCNNFCYKCNKKAIKIIADKFASIQNGYEALKTDDITVPPFTPDKVPQFQPGQVWLRLSNLSTNKATVPGDFPAKLIKHFAAYLAEPFTDIINTSIRRGEHPKINKFLLSLTTTLGGKHLRLLQI